MSNNSLTTLTQQLINAIREGSATDVGGQATRQEINYHRRDDKKIDLPSGIEGNEPMSVATAATNLARLAASESVVFDINEQIDALPWDAVCAFARVIASRYGWTDITSRTIETFFGPRKVKPDIKRVRVGAGANDFVEVPFGDLVVDDIRIDKDTPATITTEFQRSSRQPGMHVLAIKTQVRYSDRHLVLKLISDVQQEVMANSIYRGKSMRLRVRDDGSVAELPEPEFIDLSTIDERKLIHNPDTQNLLNAALFTPIRRAAACRKRNVSLKRTVLLSGTFGTGKTLTAGVTAKVAAEHGWTYISVDRPQGLKRALEIAMRFQPAVVFVEDIDRAVGLERNDEQNDILNTIDGILSKGRCEVITVMTTNVIDKIHRAMLRPGRIDTIVPVNNPDAGTIARLVVSYLGNDLAPSQDLSKASADMLGMSASTVAEVCNRAKLFAIMDDRERITAVDIEAAAHSVAYHASLVQETTEAPRSDAEIAGTALKKLLTNGAEDRHKAVISKLEDIESCVS